MTGGITFALACAVLAIVYGVWQSAQILKLPDGNERMREIAAAIREGATAYLWRQYKTIAMVGAVLFLAIGFIPQLGWTSAWGFLLGVVLSALLYFGFRFATAGSGAAATWADGSQALAVLHPWLLKGGLRPYGAADPTVIAVALFDALAWGFVAAIIMIALRRALFR